MDKKNTPSSANENTIEKAEEENSSSNFIRHIIDQDLEQGNGDSEIVTRFPPEPNGYLHIGHAKSICLNFGLTKEYKGRCHLRFDDTNPIKEEEAYVESIKEDVRWLGHNWGESLHYASDHFGKLYDFAIDLIKKNKAYVDDLNADEIREYRGTLSEPGRNSPHRDRPVNESLDLLERMKNGEFANGSRVLRAKIDMASKNLNMRDPVMYRILNTSHHRTGAKWSIYPMYDFAHGLSDSIEGVTHSLCTLEFEDHRPLYDWFLENLGVHHPKQIEFARLNLTHTVLSKRKLLQLVKENLVDGWDDPRMPTLAGLRRRGYTPHAIRDFSDRIGVAKSNSTVDISLLEHCVREDLNKSALRVMAVLNPLKIVLLNYPEDKEESLAADNNPEDLGSGQREILFSREIFIEAEDFMEEPPKKFFRLSPGKEVRLKHAYIIKCMDVIKDPDTGKIREIHCTYDPETKSGSTPDGRKVKGTLHWVSGKHAIRRQVKLFEHLFLEPEGCKNDTSLSESINPHSLKIIPEAYLEQGLKEAKAGQAYQFLRLGYFCIDPESDKDSPVFIRTVNLRDTWAKISKKLGKTKP